MEIARQLVNYEPLIMYPTFIKSNFIAVTNDQGWLFCFFNKETHTQKAQCLEGTQEMMPIFNTVALLVVLDSQTVNL